MLEAARLCEPDFAINTVLTPAGELVGLFSGDLDASHRAAYRMVERVCRVDLPCPADLVLASAGSAPNWIQSHKALVHAGRAVAADAGMVILRAPCPEGIGEESFRRWIRRPDVASMMRELRAAPDVLGQTALSTRRRAPRTILITALSEADARDLGMRTARDEEEAVQLVMQDRASSQGAAPGAPMTYYVMPEARHTVPFIARSECRGG
jgi:nickel-dependent lactate racemase